MTECERLIKAGIFSQDFLKEEIQCDFLVTSQRKRIWAIEIATLLQFDAVCKRHNLRYWLGFGALLGAVRHGGFIPWDDDIDVLMPRTDYNRLFTLGNEFSEPYFLQTPYSDPGAVFSTIRLRNSNSTWMVKEFAAEKINFGLGIDIFPLEYWKMEGKEDEEDIIRKLIYDCSTYLRRNFPNKPPESEARVLEYLRRTGGKTGLQDWEKMQRIAECVPPESADCLACLCTSGYAYNRQKWSISNFSSTLFLPFAGYEFPVPSAYSAVLEVSYGKDYMQFPPVAKRGVWHDKILFDPDEPFTKYSLA